MKTRILAFSVCFLLIGTGIFIWISSRQNRMLPPMSVIEASDVKVSTGVEKSPMKSTVPHLHRIVENMPQMTSASYRASQKISIDDFLQMTEEERWALEDEMTPEELVHLTTQISDDDLIQIMKDDIRIAKERGYMDKKYIRDLETVLDESILSIEINAKIRSILQRLSSEELSHDERNKLDEEVIRLTDELLHSADRSTRLDDSIRSHQKELIRQAEKFLNNIENEHREQPLQLKTDAEYQQQQEAFEADLAKLKSTIIEAFSDIAHIEEIDGKLEVISWYPKETLSDTTTISENSEELHGSDSILSLDDPYDPLRSLTTAQQKLKAWRAGLDVDYFDVVVSRSLTDEKRDKYFPTGAERESLKSRTSEMQKAVVSKIRTLVSEIPNATQAQKSKLARELINANFDKDFADSVLSELVKSDR